MNNESPEKEPSWSKIYSGIALLLLLYIVGMYIFTEVLK